MKSPVTYADWVDLFDRYGKGEDVLEEMSTGHFRLDAGTAERFYVRAEEAYKARKKIWLDQYQRNFNLQHIKTIEELEFVLQNNKKTLAVLAKFAHSKSLPSELREGFVKDFTGFVNDFKKNLKDNTPKDNQEREKMLMVINSFSACEFQQYESFEEISNPNSSTGRKIIF
ncbi:hypothetical protein SAMN06265171_102665 [Chryseobacterium rhizoplanae]|uniref:Uncharacterized protein n=1 Tax=Chryseobacterium rhizoplanae TaxID=1609531 RepID=A0A521CB13_9FLAO|nr:hypothetical protein [Chryseobacterium rhizoplanae]SMO56588.1 hypothetical protein SAMN06265171_102665 [Chryseobacterium rhizoplanae]